MRYRTALSGAALALFVTFLSVFVVMFVLSGLAAPTGALYLGVVSTVAMLPAIALSILCYVLFGTRYWQAIFAALAIITTFCFSYLLIDIPRSDDTVEGTVITRLGPEVAPFSEAVWIVISIFVLCVVAIGGFWALVVYRDKHKAEI